MNAVVVACSGGGGQTGEAPVSARPQKEFLRDLLLAQGIHKTPGSELDELLARYGKHLSFLERVNHTVPEVSHTFFFC